MSKDYYQQFQTVLSDTTIDDLLKKTVGYNESIEGIKRVNEWVEQNIKPDADFKEFDEIFSSCLIADEKLWFNLACYRGWMTGVVNILTLLMEINSTAVESIMQENFLALLDLKP
jgi:hypothetical protein